MGLASSARHRAQLPKHLRQKPLQTHIPMQLLVGQAMSVHGQKQKWDNIIGDVLDQLHIVQGNSAMLKFMERCVFAL